MVLGRSMAGSTVVNKDRCSSFMELSLTESPRKNEGHRKEPRSQVVTGWLKHPVPLERPWVYYI